MNHMSIRTVDVSDQPLEGAPSQPQKESAPNLNLSTAQKFHIRCVLVVPGNWKGLGGGTKGTFSFSFSFSTFLALEEALGPSSSRFRGGITWHREVSKRCKSCVPSGNLLHSYGKWQSYSWFTPPQKKKVVIFQFVTLVYQRINLHQTPLNHH